MAPSRYRLLGQVDGDPRSFDLTVGELRIGSSSASDVCLAVRGVSRQHALLVVTSDGLAVEDRGSKNGTFVNGRRVERSAVASGDRLQFGPVDLEVAQVDADDVELALVVAGAAEARTPTPAVSETTALLGGDSQAPDERWLRLAEGFAARLFATVEGDPDAALLFLKEALGVAGAALVEWLGSGEPVIIAVQGQVADVPPFREIDRPSAGPAAVSFRTEPGLTLAWLRRRDAFCPGLLVWGDFKGRSGSEAFFRVLLRVADRIRPAASPAGARAGASASATELDFPEDYRPCVSPAMTALYRQMRSVLSSDLPVLLLGETGVGKERLVSTLHRSAAGRNGPLVAINCAAIPADLLEAELFGIGKGVATGVDPRPGKFELARGGTLFLDEIGEMLPALQSKLLRVLQDRQVQPVGGAPRPVDVRIVAATNADLAQRMERGEFRRDLYYRLAAHELEVPPLRECRDDVPVLVEHFLRLYSQSAGVRLRGVTVKALRRLTAYPWPGNVRELQHEIRRVVDRCVDGGAVDAGKLSPGIVETAREGAEESDSLRPDSLLLEPRLRRLEIRMIREALRRSGGRQVQAARMLGISRNGLADKIKRLGIDVRELRPG
jgi:DNA-binding NtrC family response regulator